MRDLKVGDLCILSNVEEDNPWNGAEVIVTEVYKDSFSCFLVQGTYDGYEFEVVEKGLYPSADPDICDEHDETCGNCEFKGLARRDELEPLVN